ncbi:MAG TPA: hypothetical protein VHN77_00975 [Phycisphaerales bacterium]|nr:hypothetical protein [Phycisphaerales bacterium]
MSELHTKTGPLPEPTHDAGRERMLRALLVTLDEHQHARRLRRVASVVSAGVVVVAAVLVGARWGFHRGNHSLTPAPMIVERGPIVPPAAAPAFRCEMIATRDVASEVTVRARTTSMVQFIDDEQLLAALNQERPCYGLLRTGGRVAVLDRCVR